MVKKTPGMATMNWKRICRKEQLFNPPIFFFFWITLIFLVLFQILRLALLVYNPDQFRAIPVVVLAKAFLVGARFDLAVSLYAIAPLFLLNYLFYFFNRHGWLRQLNTVYLSLFAFLYTFLGVAELEFFKYFHVRLNAYFVNWTENPGFVLKMVWETYPVVRYLLFIGLFLVLCYGLFAWLQNKIYRQPAGQGVGVKILMFVLAIPLVFVGIRGTLSYKTPLRWGHAYFSEYNAANQLALNGVFTLANDILYQKKNRTDLGKLLGIRDRAAAYRRVEKMVQDSTGRVIHFPLREYRYQPPPRKYNVVIFLLESFSQYGIRKLEQEGAHLYFPDMARRGIYFPHFYSNGFHTYIGLFSSLFGMPNVYGKSILKRNEGQQEFSGIINILKNQGYRAYFAVSHDPNFDNMAGFLRENGVDKIVSQFDFPRKEVLSTLGVADHKLFEKMNEVFRRSSQPFVGVVLSTNNHGPWIIPEVPGHKFLSTFDYTDWALHHFFELAREESYFKNTIFVITGDHGKAETPIYDFDLQATHIPCLIYNPALIPPRVVRNITGQVDLTQMVLGLLRMSYRTTNLGRDVLHMPNRYHGFAFMEEGKKLGLIWNDWYLIDRLGGRASLYRYRSEDPRHDWAAEKPALLKEMQDRARDYYFVGNDIILNRRAAVSQWLKK